MKRKHTMELEAKVKKPAIEARTTDSNLLQDLNDNDLLSLVLSLLENKDQLGLAQLDKRYYRLFRTILTNRLFYVTTSHGPPRIRPEGGPKMALIKSGNWYFLKSIDDQAYLPRAIASENQLGTYQFTSLSSGGTNQALTTLETNTTVGVVKINGFFLGLFLTRAFRNIEINSEYVHPWKCNPEYPEEKKEKKEKEKKSKKEPEEIVHNHMEDHFLEAMNLLLTDKGLSEILEALLARSIDGNTLVITLKGTKSPCFKCACNLINFVTKVNGMVIGMRKIRVLLRCKAIGIYEGELFLYQIEALRNFVENKIALIPWGIVDRSAKLYTKRGFSHELANWHGDRKKSGFQKHFEDQEQLKKLKFFNLDKAKPLDSRYVDLRRLLFDSLKLYKSYGREVKLLQHDSQLIEDHDLELQ